MVTQIGHDERINIIYLLTHGVLRSWPSRQTRRCLSILYLRDPSSSSGQGESCHYTNASSQASRSLLVLFFRTHHLSMLTPTVTAALCISCGSRSPDNERSPDNGIAIPLLHYPPLFNCLLRVCRHLPQGHRHAPPHTLTATNHLQPPQPPGTLPASSPASSAASAARCTFCSAGTSCCVPLTTSAGGRCRRTWTRGAYR